MTRAFDSSTGLAPRTGAVLAYGGWWLTGAILWFLERRDPFVRFHAVQATLVFGAMALLIAATGLLSAASLSFFPQAFSVFLSSALVLWAIGVVLWGVAMWKAATGQVWRAPLAGPLADRMVAAPPALRRNRITDPPGGSVTASSGPSA